jgi:hypothetical protein
MECALVRAEQPVGTKYHTSFSYLVGILVRIFSLKRKRRFAALRLYQRRHDVFCVEFLAASVSRYERTAILFYRDEVLSLL